MTSHDWVDKSPVRDVPDYDFSLLSNCICQSDYRHTSLRWHLKGLYNTPSTRVSVLRRWEHSAHPHPATHTGVSVWHIESYPTFK